MGTIDRLDISLTSFANSFFHNHYTLTIDSPATARTLYGVITEFSLLSLSQDLASYRVVLQPWLALFANDHFARVSTYGIRQYMVFRVIDYFIKTIKG